MFISKRKLALSLLEVFKLSIAARFHSWQGFRAAVGSCSFNCCTINSARVIASRLHDRLCLRLGFKVVALAYEDTHGASKSCGGRPTMSTFSDLVALKQFRNTDIKCTGSTSELSKCLYQAY